MTNPVSNMSAPRRTDRGKRSLRRGGDGGRCFIGGHSVHVDAGTELQRLARTVGRGYEVGHASFRGFSVLAKRGLRSYFNRLAKIGLECPVLPRADPGGTKEHGLPRWEHPALWTFDRGSSLGRPGG